MSFVNLILTDKKYIYDKLLLDIPSDTYPKHILHQQCTKKFKLDCAFVSYLVKEIETSTLYKSSFVKKFAQYDYIVFILKSPTYLDLIDYKWNDIIFVSVRERCELEHTLSWLSTLGGAFSALGDYFENCATTAGKISFHQLQLALRLGDPNIASRCKLYLSLSLIQRGKFKLAKTIISKEYNAAITATVVDLRLVRMCKGIWSKLKYEHDLHRKNKKIK